MQPKVLCSLIIIDSLPGSRQFLDSIPGNEVAVKHFGNGVLLLPIDDPWQMLVAGLEAFEPGFVFSRDQPEQQRRDSIDP
jgi:virulence-associated protein VagC